MFPDFIGIGAQKAGTTWLDRNLRRHPQIWMPPLKELHYFDEKIKDPSSTLVFLPTKVFGKRPADERWRNQFKTRIKGDVKAFSAQNLLWDLNYYMRAPTNEWYASLFEQGRAKITGDITPGYSILEPYMISRIHKLMPETKIIFMMRNPIERAWSHAVMNFDKLEKGSASAAADNELLQKFKRRDSRLQTNYLRTLENWSVYYPRERIFVGFLEDIHFFPEPLMRELCGFLGANTSSEYQVRKGKIHSRTVGEMPTHMAVHLARAYYELLERLSERFGGYASFWLYCAKRLIEDTPKEEGLPYPLWESRFWEEWSVKTEGPPTSLQSGPLSSIREKQKGKPRS